jgi:hypothetical protein
MVMGLAAPIECKGKIINVRKAQVIKAAWRKRPERIRKRCENNIKLYLQQVMNVTEGMHMAENRR